MKKTGIALIIGKPKDETSEHKSSSPFGVGMALEEAFQAIKNDDKDEFIVTMKAAIEQSIIHFEDEEEE